MFGEPFAEARPATPVDHRRRGSPVYAFRCFNTSHSILWSRHITCRDDAAALATAAELMRFAPRWYSDIEVWRGRQVIGRIDQHAARERHLAAVVADPPTGEQQYHPGVL